MQYLILFIGGLAAGFFSSLIGIGGGFILVPLFFLIRVKPSIAGASSVALTATIAMLSSIHYYKIGKIDKIAALQAASGAIIGGLLGVIAVHLIKNSALLKTVMETGFVLLVFVMAARMTIDVWFNLNQKTAHSNVAVKGVSIGMVTGFISVILGVGGGFAYVPTFLYLYDLPSQVAVGTSLSVITVSNGLATIENLFINHTVSLSYYLSALSGAILGIKISRFIEIPAKLRKIIFLVILLSIFVENLVNLLF